MQIIIIIIVIIITQYSLRDYPARIGPKGPNVGGRSRFVLIIINTSSKLIKITVI